MGLNKDTSSWETVKMKDIAIANNGIVDGPFGSNLKTADYINDSINGVPVLTTKNLNGDFSDKSVRYISKNKYEKLKRSAVFPGDILVAKIGSIGKCCIYPPNQRIALIPANLLKITLREDYYIKYVYYYIQSPDFQALIKSITKATAQPAFNVTRFRELPISVPCYSEQLKIVQNLEESLSQLDSAVATLNKTKQQLEIYRQAVLKEVFSFDSADQLVEISQITDYIRIGPFGTMLHKSDYVNDGIPVINPQHIKNGVIVPSSKNSISVEKAKELNNYQLKTNDIIMGRRGEMGRSAPVTDIENGWLCGTGSIFFRLKPDFDASLYSKILSSPAIVHYLEENATGTTMKNLNEDIVSHIPVPYIDKSKQNKIMQRLEEQLSVCDDIETTIYKSLQQAEALRQSILKKAFEDS